MDKLRNPKYIILHHSLTKDGKTVSWSAIRRYHVHELNWATIGYHFGLELVGDHYEILIGRMLNQIGAHCKGYNHESIGICFVGNFDIEAPENSQLIAGKNLIRSLLDVFNLDRWSVKGHCDFSDKTCPGKLFPLGSFIEQL